MKTTPPRWYRQVPAHPLLAQIDALKIERALDLYAKMCRCLWAPNRLGYAQEILRVLHRPTLTVLP